MLWFVVRFSEVLLGIFLTIKHRGRGRGWFGRRVVSLMLQLFLLHVAAHALVPLAARERVK